MKQKLVCALVLLLVCAALSPVAVAVFTDSAEIGVDYSEAVAAMVERGVLEGFEDGSFRPNETLTREQGAKIIVYLCIGKDDAQKLSCDEAPFSDVSADRWSAPCIAWCVDHGILHGYGDGNYGPSNLLTGDQYAKMLLCALDLARGDQSAYIGAKWVSAVREDAEAAKLYTGDAGMESMKPLSREQAALMSWNALQAAEEAEQDDLSDPASTHIPTPTPAQTPAATPKPTATPEPTATPAMQGDNTLPDILI